MQGILSLFIILSTAAFSAAPPSSLEFWFYRPQLPVADVRSEKAMNVPGLDGGKPVKEEFSVTGIVWEGETLRVGKISASVVFEDLTSSIDAPVIGKQPLFSFPGARFDLESLAEIPLTFPEQVALNLVAGDGGVHFQLADDGLKQHVQAQLESLLSPQAFDRNFRISPGGGLSDLAKKAVIPWIESQKPKFLDSAREQIGKSLSPEVLTKMLALGGGILPDVFPGGVKEGKWVLRRMRVPRLVVGSQRNEDLILWRLAPEEQITSQSLYRLPTTDLSKRNMVSVVAPQGLLQNMVEHSLTKRVTPSQDAEAAPSVLLSKEESGVVSKVFDLLLPQDSQVHWIASGERGPKVRAWTWMEKRGKHMLDVLICLSEDARLGTGEHPLHAIAEFGEKGIPSLVAMRPVGVTAAQAQAMVRSPEWPLLQKMVDEHLQQIYKDGVPTSTRLEPVGIRVLGDAGKRTDSTVLGEMVSIDYDLR